MIKKEYTNGEVTIGWQPDKCIHSERCFKGLPGVFRPKEKPWIVPEAASTKAIVKQVEQCPSGALTYNMNNGKAGTFKDKTMSDIKIKVTENGPLVLSGGVTVEHKDGKTETKNSAAFCRCGHSGNKPYCDGSHKVEGFVG